jgi:N-acetylglutamate synthase-like GNAT family acetyltransferase
VTLSTRKEDIDVRALCDLFEKGAFWARGRSTTDLQHMLHMSDPVVCAHLEDRLVGFARATGDGVYRAVIWDVVVHPQCQGQGIGRLMVESLLAHPSIKNVERVYLMTTFQQGFYEKLGFSKNASTTMVRLRKADRAG